MRLALKVAAGFLVLTAFHLAGTTKSISSRVLRSALKEEKADEARKFSFDDIFNSNFSYNSVNPQWISGNKYIYSTSDRDVYIRNVANMEEDTLLMNGSVYKDNLAWSYMVSSTQNYILLLTNYKKGWRHSFTGDYLLFDVSAQAIDDENPLEETIQYIAWSPTGDALMLLSKFNGSVARKKEYYESSLNSCYSLKNTEGCAIPVFVKDYDIYYRETPTSVSFRITNNGKENEIYNGIPDWVYEEEMISDNNVIYFSPDGKKIAYAQFDDSECDHIEFIRYDNENYPKLIDVSYPKAGTTQPTSKVFIYDVESQNEVEIMPQQSLIDNGDYLFNRVVWASDDEAAVLWCDRAQTWSVMSMCKQNLTGPDLNWTCSEAPAYEHSVKDGWLYQRRPYWIPVFGNTTDEFFKVLPNDDWQHLARIDIEDQPHFLTEGNFTVTSESASYPAVYFYDKSSDYVYFLATKEDPGKRQIYRTKGHGELFDVQCVSCKVANNYSGRCDYLRGSFSTDGSYVIIECRGESAPIDILYRVDHSAITADQVLVDENVLEANEDLMNAIQNTAMSTAMHDKILSCNGFEFYYELWTPHDFNPDADKKYPLLIDVYAGPGYQNVDYAWTRSWAPRYVPVNFNAVVLRVDGRGSNFYGDQFMHAVYKQLGQKEVEDQIKAARCLIETKPFIDSNKVAIWGWSYGGFATSHAVALGSDVIKCGLAVAPLIDWELYDTIYAERYMGLPKENRAGYDSANIRRDVSNFSKSKYFLVHGMTDDNVHFQNAALLEKELVKNEIDFKSFFYADQDHSINVGNARRHVYKILSRELAECFDQEWKWP